MAECTDPPAKAPKKKRTLAFLRNIPKPAPTHDEDAVDLDDNQGKQKVKEDDDEDDGLNMFKRSKDFFPTVIKKQELDPRKAVPDSKAQVRKHAAEDSDEKSLTSSSPSSKRRRVSSPVPEADHPWRFESYDELYGPATPPRRASKSPTPASRKSYRKQSTPASARRSEPATSPIDTGKGRGKGKDTVDLVQSDLLPTPSSQSNSHQLPTEVSALVDDEDDAVSGAEDRTGHTPSPRKSQVETTSPITQAPADAILIDDSSDDDLFATESEPKEDEFAHFIAAARERREAAKAAAAALASSNETFENGQDPLSPNAAQALVKKNEPYLRIKIFIYSRIAAYADYDMRGFGCHRKIDQTVGPVRNAFVQWLRQKGVPVSEEMDQAIFLTWKGRRIFNSVSGQGLGWQPQGSNKTYAAERESGFIRDGVLLEAWTEEDFERYTADLERQRLLDRGELVEEGPGDETDGDSEEKAELKTPKIRLSLKEKDREPFKLTAFLYTQVRILIGVYRKQMKVAEDREIRLAYEGDWLGPDMTVEQADIDDMCTVEVYVR